MREHEMQTILGANGVIGRELSRALPACTDRIRQVSCSPQRVNPADEVAAADLLDAEGHGAGGRGQRGRLLVAG